MRLVRFCFSLILPGVIALTGCRSAIEPSVVGPGTSIFSSIFGADLSARGPSNNRRSGGGDEDGNDGGNPRGRPDSQTTGAIFPGRDVDAVQAAAAQTPTADEINLSFEQADLQAVVQTILGDALGLTYAIDPNVTGLVTLSSAKPIAKSDLLPMLEVVLQMNGWALVKDGALYKIIPDGGPAQGGIDRATARPGYGITVIPLRYVSAQTLTSLIEGFGARPGQVRVERSRNLLLVFGSGNDRRAAVETALSFDEDWMAGQTVGILPVRDTVPETVIPELEAIFKSREGGAGNDTIQFLAMSRIKSVLAISQDTELIERARLWVSRLDRRDASLEAGVYVYRARYNDAKRLVEILTSIFSESTTTPAAEPAADQVNPAEPAVATTLQTEPLAAEGPFSPRTDVTSNAPTPALPAQTGRVRFSYDQSNNSVIMYADADVRQRVLAALRQLDVPPLQVAINVTMAEIRLNDQLRHGVQFFIKENADRGSIGLFNTIANTISRELPGFNFLLGSEKSPDIIISAFDQITDVQVLSSPTLVVAENEPARLQVGDQIPVTVRQVQATNDANAPIVNSIEFRDTGIILNVRARVSENGIVSMDIDQEVSTVSGQQSLTPTISRRRISSSVSVADGQTVLLGGLISENSNTDKDGIPVLNRIHGLGDLLGRRNYEAVRSELIILIRPSVIRGGQDAQQVAEDLRSRMWAIGTSTTPTPR